MYFKKFVKKIIQKCISFLSDERDAIQKKTFTKWVNKHLKKVRHKQTQIYLINVAGLKKQRFLRK